MRATDNSKGAYDLVKVIEGWWGPVGVAVDADGNIYVADNSTDKIFKFDQEGKNKIEIKAGITPRGGVAVDRAGTVYFTGGHWLRKATRSAGGYEVERIHDFGQFGLPTGVAVDAEGKNVYVTDRYSGVLKKYNANGNISDVATFRGVPWGIAVDKNGSVYVNTWSDGTVWKLTPESDYKPEVFIR